MNYNIRMMPCFRRSPILVLIPLVVTFLIASPLNGADRATVERGRYLAVEVARCQECHTPTPASGDFDKSLWIKGATLNIQAIEPVEDWHKKAPDLTPTGKLWANWGEAGLKKYLETGLTPRGRIAGPPMPSYTMTREDAEAIVEYLKSLP